MRSNSVNVDKKARRSAIAALSFLVPIASIGILMTTYIDPGVVGKSIYSLSKLWLIAFPWLWRVKVEKKTIKLPSLKQSKLWFGLVLGLLMGGIIIAAYWFIGRSLIDPVTVREQAEAIGLNSITVFFLGVAYWSFVNAFIEEAVWRGFVFRYCRKLFRYFPAVAISALFFTLHHIIAMAYYLQNPLLVFITSFGVFAAGWIWSACYQKAGFWACYISHIIADLAIGLVGWHLLFS